MENIMSQISQFLETVRANQSFWALQDKNGEDWVVLDSTQFEETDVLPVWSSQEAALAHCTEDWAEFEAAEITLADWLEFWVEDLAQDNIVIGVNWEVDSEELVELELADFSQQLADVEKL